jgi:hypothetical protein
LIASQTDPWLTFEDAKKLAHHWHASLHDLGDAGHINVASGYGAWSEVFYHLDALNAVYEHYETPQNNRTHCQTMRQSSLAVTNTSHQSKQILSAF